MSTVARPQPTPPRLVSRRCAARGAGRAPRGRRAGGAGVCRLPLARAVRIQQRLGRVPGRGDLLRPARPASAARRAALPGLLYPVHPRRLLPPRLAAGVAGARPGGAARSAGGLPRGLLSGALRRGATADAARLRRPGAGPAPGYGHLTPALGRPSGLVRRAGVCGHGLGAGPLRPGRPRALAGRGRPGGRGGLRLQAEHRPAESHGGAVAAGRRREPAGAGHGAALAAPGAPAGRGRSSGGRRRGAGGRSAGARGPGARPAPLLGAGVRRAPRGAHRGAAAVPAGGSGAGALAHLGLRGRPLRAAPGGGVGGGGLDVARDGGRSPSARDGAGAGARGELLRPAAAASWPGSRR